MKPTIKGRFIIVTVAVISYPFILLCGQGTCVTVCVCVSGDVTMRACAHPGAFFFLPPSADPY